MKTKQKLVFFFLALIGIVLFFVLNDYSLSGPVLDPKGLIGLQQANLIWIATLIMLIIVIPVFIMAFAISWRYRAGNKSAEYTPHWHDDPLAEAIWWGFPCLIVILLSIVTWRSSHQLDPFVPLKTSVTPVQIQVVALQWKWLFIYPEQKIASLNFLQFPEETPLNFEITSDAPMNSFWIPDLGGQIYAMPGMVSKLHLIAGQLGEFRGSSANLSGSGFAGMHFIAKASSREDFDTWVQTAQAAESLDKDKYKALVLPSEYNPAELYALSDENLFNQIVMKYMVPPKDLDNTEKPEVAHN